MPLLRSLAMLDGKTQLLQTLRPILEHLEQLPAPNDDRAARAIETDLDRAFPYDGELVQRIGAAVHAALDAGWLCDRGEAPVRFGRLAKPSPETHGFSIDAVELSGPATGHAHPRGEITLGFARPAAESSHSTARFEDRPPGWVCMPAGSRHVPTVTGGTMALLYFLPAGAIDWTG